MGNFLKALDPYRWLVGGVIVATLIGGFFWYRASLIDMGREEVKADVSKQALKQIERAQDQASEWKVRANETDARNQELAEALLKLSGGNAAGAGRLRDSAPSAKQLAGASAETCWANAAEAEHDLGECAVRYSALGDTAAGAAQKAWEFHDKWPEYREFQSKLTDFTNRLKGQ